MNNETLRLGGRAATIAFGGMTLAISLAAACVVYLWSWIASGTSSAELEAADYAVIISSLAKGIDRSFDDLSALAVTVLLAFYIAVIGGQYARGLDVIALRSRLSGASLIGAAGFCAAGEILLGGIVVSGESSGRAMVVVTEIVLVAALSIELSSWVLLRRDLQLEVYKNTAHTAETTARRARESLSGSVLPPWGEALLALVVPMIVGLLTLAVRATPSLRQTVGLALLVLWLQGVLALLAWARVTSKPREHWPVFLPIAFSTSVVLVTAGMLWEAGNRSSSAAVSVTSILVLFGNVNLLRRQRFRCEGNLQSLAIWFAARWSERSRRRALWRLEQLQPMASTDRSDHEGLAWSGPGDLFASGGSTGGADVQENGSPPSARSRDDEVSTSDVPVESGHKACTTSDISRGASRAEQIDPLDVGGDLDERALRSALTAKIGMRLP